MELMRNAIAYLNVDMAASGHTRFDAKAVPRYIQSYFTLFTFFLQFKYIVESCVCFYSLQKTIGNSTRG